MSSGEITQVQIGADSYDISVSNINWTQIKNKPFVDVNVDSNFLVDRFYDSASDLLTTFNNSNARLYGPIQPLIGTNPLLPPSVTNPSQLVCPSYVGLFILYDSTTYLGQISSWEEIDDGVVELRILFESWWGSFVGKFEMIFIYDSNHPSQGIVYFCDDISQIETWPMNHGTILLYETEPYIIPDALPKASSLEYGAVKVDGTTITAVDGVISADNRTNHTSGWYGTSTTTTATTAKTATCSDYALLKGNIITILFTYGNTATAPTLSVNSTTAKSIYVNNAVASATNPCMWPNNTLVTFIYDGTYYRYLGQERYAHTYYGSTSSTGATVTVTSAEFELQKGAVVLVQATAANNDVSAAKTLNVNSTGAKTVYKGNAATSSSNTLKWASGDVLTFIYDGTYWRYGGSSAGGAAEMVVLSYGNSTWNDFINAYNTNSIVYCKASSNSNPASGAQTRMAFMAYVNADPPTNVEFQYYRSVSSHSIDQQGDQVFIYKLDQSTGWSVTTREASAKIVAGENMTATYSNNTLTLSALPIMTVTSVEPTDSNILLWIDPTGGGLPAAAGVNF